uniref:Uncharacterized protein n=1 Tax=Timema poppense TaxID=170557 RepID=A0A7R9D657_TIMPO|nr:unnamed protein product [Timema poppensis]
MTPSHHLNLGIRTLDSSAHSLMLDSSNEGINDIQNSTVSQYKLLSTWKNKKEQLDAEVRAKTEVLNQLKIEKQTLEGEVQGSQFRVADWEKKVANNQKNIAQMKQDVTNITKQTEAKKREFEDDLKSYKTAMCEYAAKMMSAPTTYDRKKLSEEVQALKQQAKQVQAELQTVKEELGGVKSQFLAMTGSPGQSDTPSALRSVIKQMDADESGLSEENLKLREELENLEQVSNSLKDELNTLKQKGQNTV